jgi:hypothetical protein
MGCALTVDAVARQGSIAEGPPVSIGGAPREWAVQIVKREGDVLGADLGKMDNDGAVIFSIQEDGLLDAWNRTHLSNPLRPGLIITEVNGAVGYWDILEELRRPGVLDMKLSPEPPSSSGPNWSQEVTKMVEKWSFEAQGGRGAMACMLRLQPQDHFSSLPTVRAADCGVNQCAICIDDVGPDESLLLLPCNHAYHPVCVARWLTQGASGSKKHSCPLCCRRLVSSPEGFVAVGADDPSASWPLSRPRRSHSRRSSR